MAVGIFAALPHACLSSGHIAVDVVSRRLSRRWQCVLMVAQSLLGFLLFAGITWGLGIFLWDAIQIGRTTIATRIPIAPFVAVAAITALATTVAYFLQALAEMTSLTSYE